MALRFGGMVNCETVWDWPHRIYLGKELKRTQPETAVNVKQQFQRKILTGNSSLLNSRTLRADHLHTKTAETALNVKETKQFQDFGW